MCVCVFYCASAVPTVGVMCVLVCKTRFCCMGNTINHQLRDCIDLPSSTCTLCNETGFNADCDRTPVILTQRALVNQLRFNILRMFPATPELSKLHQNVSMLLGRLGLSATACTSPCHRQAIAQEYSTTKIEAMPPKLKSWCVRW